MKEEFLKDIKKENDKFDFNSIREKIKKEETVFKGGFLKVNLVEVELPNKKIAYRDVVRHPGAVAILTLNENNEVLLEYQYRTAIDEIIMEIPAGKLEKGEDIKEAALRELKEETGLYANKIEYLGKTLVAAGYSDEIIHIYLAKDLTKGTNDLDEDEFVL